MDTKNFFQISEAAHACGVSRSTIMRMEEKCLLKPIYISPESGRRYYDNHNVARILQIEKFKSMGLSTEDIIEYFNRGGEAANLLKILESKLHDLTRSVEELRIRAEKSGSISVQIMNLPEVICCMRKCEGHTIQEKYDAMYDFYSECVRKGFKLSSEPIFSISERRDYLDGYIGDTPYPFWVGIPMIKEKAPKESVVLPACKALSVLYCGGYDGIDNAWLTLGKEVKARGLKAKDFPRVLGIVAPYTGREIETRRYCHRLVLPIEE